MGPIANEPAPTVAPPRPKPTAAKSAGKPKAAAQPQLPNPPTELDNKEGSPPVLDSKGGSPKEKEKETQGTVASHVWLVQLSQAVKPFLST